MGKRAREIRSATKIFARSCGYKETELGELQPHMTKAEARRRFLELKWHLSALVITSLREIRAIYEENKLAFQIELLSLMHDKVIEECDAQIFAELEAA